MNNADERSINKFEIEIATLPAQLIAKIDQIIENDSWYKMKPYQKAWGKEQLYMKAFFAVKDGDCTMDRLLENNEMLLDLFENSWEVDLGWQPDWK